MTGKKYILRYIFKHENFKITFYVFMYMCSQCAKFSILFLAGNENVLESHIVQYSEKIEFVYFVSFWNTTNAHVLKNIDNVQRLQNYAH